MVQCGPRFVSFAARWVEMMKQRIAPNVLGVGLTVLALGLTASAGDLAAKDSVDRSAIARGLETSFREQIEPLITEYCVHCHNADEMTSGVRLDHLRGAWEDQEFSLGKKILRQVSSEVMPPEDEPQPSSEQRQAIVDWTRHALEFVKSRPAEKNGSVRRLTVAQYRNTLRDLLGIEDDLTDVLAPDAVSRDGFVNQSQTMLLSPLLIEAYFDIAERALDRCLIDNDARPEIQNFRVDFGRSINKQPCPDALILGTLSALLKNEDFVVTELTPVKPFDFRPHRMQTRFRFIEGYQGNETVREWREFDGIYHAVFACVRGTNGYPKGHAWETVPTGLLLRPAIPSSEIFAEESTYGPMANFKIALRELPDQGNCRITVTAAKYDDGLLLDPGVEAQDEAAEGTIAITNLAGSTMVDVPTTGIYQVDVHLQPVTKQVIPPDASNLHHALIGAWPLDGNVRSQAAAHPVEDAPAGENPTEYVGRLEGDASFVESPFGQALSVDGDSGFVTIEPDETMNVEDGDFTVAAWIYPRKLRNSGIVVRGAYDYKSGWTLDMPGDNGVLRIGTAIANGEPNGSVESWEGAIRPNRWQHVAAVVRRGQSKTRLYVNGYEVGEGTVGAADLDNPNVDLHIGRLPGGPLFAGEIDEVHLYRRSLNVAEIEALVEPGRQFAVVPPRSSAAANLVLQLGDRHFSGRLDQPAFMAVRLTAGPLAVTAKYGDATSIQRIQRIVFTPLTHDDELAQQFQAFDGRAPHLGVHVGLRRDDGSALARIGRPQTVSSTEPVRIVFEGAIGNFPRHHLETGNANYLAGVHEIAVRSEYTDGRDMPRLLIRSIEFEGPLYETWPPKTHRRIFMESPHQDDRSVYAQQVIRSFATRAFRRPLTDAEEESLYAVWQQSVHAGRGFRQSIRDALLVVLTSPQFLFLIETSDGPQAETLDGYELASKLSYFLWNTSPDEQLLKLAAANRLHDSLDSQIDRMIADPRFAQFAEEFVSQWLSLDKLDVVEVDRKRYPRLKRDMKSELRKEPVYYLMHLIQDNLSLRNLIQSDFMLANEVVASYYNLADQTESGFEFVVVRHENENLGGVLSQAGILAGLSDGHESNPVKRGAWLARKIIAEPPEDPPPNVPELDDDLTHLSLRERLARHRDQPGCANCHSGIDPWGFPFEQFDAAGLFRKVDQGDAASTLPDGARVTGLKELKQYLADDRLDRVAFSFMKHLAVYAIGREIHDNEVEFLKEKVLELKADGYPVQDLIRAVIKSELFLEK